MHALVSRNRNYVSALTAQIVEYYIQPPNFGKKSGSFWQSNQKNINLELELMMKEREKEGGKKLGGKFKCGSTSNFAPPLKKSRLTVVVEGEEKKKM